MEGKVRSYLADSGKGTGVLPLHLGSGGGFMLKEGLIIHLGCKHCLVVARVLLQCCFF